jgi:hypothetical protein
MTHTLPLGERGRNSAKGALRGGRRGRRRSRGGRRAATVAGFVDPGAARFVRHARHRVIRLRILNDVGVSHSALRMPMEFLWHKIMRKCIRIVGNTPGILGVLLLME